MTAINQWCAKAQKWFKSVEERLGLELADELHLVISFLLAWVMRGCVLESWWAWLPLTIIFVAKEFYDRYKPKTTGFSWKDLMLDYIGAFVGYWLGALCTLW